MRHLLSSVLTLLFVLSVLSCKSPGESQIDWSLIPVSLQGRFGYIDLEGKIKINPQFSDASLFRDGRALVNMESGWGYIDEKGVMVIPARYKSATIFSQGIAWVVPQLGSPQAIGKDGALLFELKDANRVRVFSDGLAAYSVVDSLGLERWGFLKTSGQIAIPAIYEDVGSFGDGLAAVLENGLWGYANREGTLVIRHQFSHARSFNNGYATVGTEEGWGVIGSDGLYVVNPVYSEVISDDDHFWVKLNDRFGWIDASHAFRINPQFDSAYPFGNSSFAPVKLGDKYGYVDKEGKYMANPQFEEAFPFINGRAFARLNDKVGIIDENARFVVNPQFDGLAADVRSKFSNSVSPYAEVVTDKLDMLNSSGLTSFYLSERSISKDWGFRMEPNQIYVIELVESETLSIFDLQLLDSNEVAVVIDVQDGTYRRFFATRSETEMRMRLFNYGNPAKGKIKITKVKGGMLTQSKPIFGTIDSGEPNKTYGWHLVELGEDPMHDPISSWINLESDDFDTYLSVYSLSNASMRWTDDDGGEGYNSRLLITPERGVGLYLIRVSSYSGRGRYRLSMESAWSGID